jgi:hypothetical protein
MVKTRVVEVVPQSDNLPPKEVELGFCELPEPLMERKVPVPDKSGQMPPPIMVTVGGERFFVIGYTYDITVSTTLDDAPTATYVLIVQKVPSFNSGLVRAGAGAMDQIKALIPEPGRKQ